MIDSKMKPYYMIGIKAFFSITQRKTTLWKYFIRKIQCYDRRSKQLNQKEVIKLKRGRILLIERTD